MNLYKTIGITLITILAFTLISCNCCKKASCTKTKEDGTYNLVMAFWSQSSGPDRKAHKAFNDYMDAIEDKDKKLSIEKVSWGKEAEKDYCINFLCIKKKERLKITTDLKAIAESSKITALHENASCKHKK